MTVPVWVVVVALLVVAYLIYYAVSVTKERDKYNNESQSISSELTHEKTVREKHEKAIEVFKQDIDALNKLLGNETEKSTKQDLQINSLSSQLRTIKQQLSVYKSFYDKAQSNLSLFPYMAGIVSEFETRDIEVLARRLDWGASQERAKKVASIRSIRHDAQEKINRQKKQNTN